MYDTKLVNLVLQFTKNSCLISSQLKKTQTSMISVTQAFTYVHGGSISSYKLKPTIECSELSYKSKINVLGRHFILHLQ